MAHGAPDHVQMMDVNMLDYVDHYYHLGGYDIGGGETWEFVTVAGVGCVGLIYFYGKARSIYLTVTVDGTIVFHDLLIHVHTWHTSTGQPLSNRAGISIYNDDIGKYGMWLDFHYQMSFKSTLQIALRNDLVGIYRLNDITAYWKERS